MNHIGFMALDMQGVVETNVVVLFGVILTKSFNPLKS